jgi:tetratricopeptide (TPR) repeat protein
VLLAPLGLLTWQQTRTYANSETLWRTTTARNPNSYLAEYNLGCALLPSGRADEAMFHFQQALQLEPNFADAHNNLGALYAARARFDDAIVEFQQSLRLKPGFQKAQINLEAARAAKANPASTRPPR